MSFRYYYTPNSYTAGATLMMFSVTFIVLCSNIQSDGFLVLVCRADGFGGICRKLLRWMGDIFSLWLHQEMWPQLQQQPVRYKHLSCLS